jgi:hypothetical protein
MREFSDGAKLKIAAFIFVWAALGAMGWAMMKAQGPTDADLKALEERERMFEAAEAMQRAYELTRPTFNANDVTNAMQYGH